MSDVGDPDGDLVAAGASSQLESAPDGPVPGDEASDSGAIGETEAPAGAEAPASPPASAYREKLRSLADRVLEAQRPLRILQALRWDAGVEETFLRSDRRELPRVSYAGDLGFDAGAKILELDGILADAERDLGPRDPLGAILSATADEYREVVRMLVARGTRGFYESSCKLYGSTRDLFPGGSTSVRDMGATLRDLFASIPQGEPEGAAVRDVTADEAARELNARFERFFGTRGARVGIASEVRVEVDDGLLADAAAGSDYVKIRTGATFSRSDIDILEAHEGWVHVATSLNGQLQPYARWLAKGPPRTTAAQEGLAALVEILTLRITPRRAKKLNDRILAVAMAEDGASFVEVFEWYRAGGYDDAECFQSARRVFRGGLLEGGAPFTKDACYGRGIALNYAFMRAALEQRRAELIPMLFVGKVAHEDVPVLHAYVEEGIIEPPPFLPPIFEDVGGLAVWLAYSGFLSRLGGPELTGHYARLLG